MDLSTQAAFALLSLCVLGEAATSLWAVAFLVCEVWVRMCTSPSQKEKFIHKAECGDKRAALRPS